jgi:hypothetical protein
MVQWGNVHYHTQKEQVMGEWAKQKQDPAPQKPAEYAEASPPAPRLVTGSSSGRLFVEMPADKGYRSHQNEATGRLTLMLGSEAKHVELDIEALLLLQAEISLLVTTIQNTNDARRAHHAALKDYEDKRGKWEKRANKALTNRFKKGDITEAMLADEEEIAKIRF